MMRTELGDIYRLVAQALDGGGVAAVGEGIARFERLLTALDERPPRDLAAEVRLRIARREVTPWPLTLTLADEDAAAAIDATTYVHHPDRTPPFACDWCGGAWPCHAVRAVAAAVGIEVGSRG
jgi:hypothetical protein